MRDMMESFQSMTRGMDEIAAKKNNPAGFMQQRMMDLIAEHQKSLSAEDELGVHVIGGSAPAFHLRAISYSNPDILIFIGKDVDGNIVQLMQHHSQMSVMVVSLPKLDEKAFRIGFVQRKNAE